MENKEIIVLGMNYSTPLGVIRALGEAGYLVNVILVNKNKSEQSIVSSSKYIKSFYAQTDKDGAKLIEYLKSTYSGDNLKLLLPTDDFTTSVIDKYKDLLDSSFKFPHVGKNGIYSINQMMDKEIQSNIIEVFQLKEAESHSVDLRAFTEDELQALPYPCIIKPQQSINGRKKEIVVCRDKQALSQTLRHFKQVNSKRSFLVQKYLDIETEYSFFGMCWGEQLIMSLPIKKLRVSEAHMGLTLSGEFVAWDALETVKDKLEAFLKSIDYYGMFGLEIFLLKNGEIYFNELNLRASGINYFVTKNGLNIPVIFVEALENNQLTYTAEKSLPLGTAFFNDRVAWDEYLSGNMSESELKQYEANADCFLISQNVDEGPRSAYEKYLARKKRKFALRKILSYFNIFKLFCKN